MVDDAAFAAVSGTHAVTGIRQKPLESVMSAPGPGAHYHPYESDEDDSETSSSGSESGRTTESTEAEQEHDGRMQALDTWRSAAQQWISGPGRTPVSDTVLPIRPRPMLAMAGATPSPQTVTAGAPTASATDIPADLRANDIRRYVLHVDSRFRESPSQSTAGDFYLRPLAPLKNVLRVRVVSVEMPYSYPFFTQRRRNVRFDVWDLSGAPAPPVVIPIAIPAGNYTPSGLVSAVNAALTAAGVTWLTVTYAAEENRYTFTSTRLNWTLDMTAGDTNWDRPFDYGLGYYLGVPRAVVDISGVTTYTPPGCAVIGGDNYLFLKMNDFDCIHQPVSYVTPTSALSNHEFTALAKIRLRADRNAVAFDDYAGQVLKEVVFFSPRDIPRLHVQVLDAYGEVVDLCTAEFSVALEVLEIQNVTLFDSMRNSIMMSYA